MYELQQVGCAEESGYLEVARLEEECGNWRCQDYKCGRCQQDAVMSFYGIGVLSKAAS